MSNINENLILVRLPKQIAFSDLPSSKIDVRKPEQSLTIKGKKFILKRVRSQHQPSSKKDKKGSDDLENVHFLSAVEQQEEEVAFKIDRNPLMFILVPHFDEVNNATAVNSLPQKTPTQPSLKPANRFSGSVFLPDSDKNPAKEKQKSDVLVINKKTAQLATTTDDSPVKEPPSKKAKKNKKQK